MAERRELRFTDWNEVRADLSRLESGYEVAGSWHLDQTAKHLGDWLRFPMDGFPKVNFIMRMMFGALRMTMGPFLFRKILREKKMKDGIPTVPKTVYEADEASIASSLSTLRDTIARFESHDGEIIPSPVFGMMDKDQCQQLQLVHFAHHLSWLVPRD